jgi:hypothetical protein
MDVILNLKHPRVELTIPSGSSIARDLIYEQAGLTARDSSGNSLMSQIHLGLDGVYDAGFTPDAEGEHIVSSFFEAGGRFYNIGKDITLAVRYEKPQPVATADPVDFGFEMEPVISPVESVVEPPAPVANAEPRLTLIRQDDNTYTYELDKRLGDRPGLYRIPDLDQVIEVPEGKEFVDATLVVYPTYSNGDPVEQIELANGATFHSPHIQWSSGIEEEMPFGIDDGSDIYGIWYGLIATLRDIPKPEPKSAWGNFAKPKPAPVAPAEEQPAPSPWAQAVQPTQAARQPEPEPDPEEQSGLGDIWGDEPRLDEVQGYTAPISPHPELQETRRFDTTALRTAPEFNFETDDFDYEQPQLVAAHASPEEEELQPAPAAGKKGLFGKKPKADKPAKPAKAPKPAKTKRANEPGAKKGRGGLIAAVVGGLSVIGLAVGGFFYYQDGVKAAEPLKTEITATNKEISAYLDKDEISSEDTTELAALVQKNDDAFNAFKPGNFIAQQKENELIRETQELIDKVYAKLNG